MMPVMNGWQFAEAIQKDRLFAAIPLVIVTAYAEQADGIRSDGVIKKPVDLDELSAVLRRHSLKEAG